MYVKVKPVLGKPACPSSIKAGKKFTVSGSLKPRYPAGSKNVKVKAQRYASGKWKAYKTYTATTADSGSYSKYSVRLSISKKGKYRFYATTAEHEHALGRQERVQPHHEGEVRRAAGRAFAAAPATYHEGRHRQRPAGACPPHADPPPARPHRRRRAARGMALHGRRSC